jgi:N-acetylneuraminate lyase
LAEQTREPYDIRRWIAGKRIMKLIGLDLGNNRLPFQNLSGDEEISLKKELENIGFFERCNKF